MEAIRHTVYVNNGTGKKKIMRKKFEVVGDTEPLPDRGTVRQKFPQIFALMKIRPYFRTPSTTPHPPLQGGPFPFCLRPLHLYQTCLPEGLKLILSTKILVSVSGT